jgi:hypothetical protein
MPASTKPCAPSRLRVDSRAGPPLAARAVRLNVAGTQEARPLESASGLEPDLAHVPLGDQRTIRRLVSPPVLVNPVPAQHHRGRREAGVVPIGGAARSGGAWRSVARYFVGLIQPCRVVSCGAASARNLWASPALPPWRAGALFNSAAVDATCFVRLPCS